MGNVSCVVLKFLTVTAWTICPEDNARATAVTWACCKVAPPRLVGGTIARIAIVGWGGVVTWPSTWLCSIPARDRAWSPLGPIGPAAVHWGQKSIQQMKKQKEIMQHEQIFQTQGAHYTYTEVSALATHQQTNWLQYRILSMTYKCLHGTAPSYCGSWSLHISRHNLCCLLNSQDSAFLVLKKTLTKNDLEPDPRSLKKYCPKTLE